MRVKRDMNFSVWTSFAVCHIIKEVLLCSRETKTKERYSSSLRSLSHIGGFTFVCFFPSRRSAARAPTNWHSDQFFHFSRILQHCNNIFMEVFIFCLSTAFRKKKWLARNKHRKIWRQKTRTLIYFKTE